MWRGRGCIQYDPLDVVGRNADLTLQSRIPGYKPEHLLKALYKDRTLLDGFDKNLSIYPACDFPCFSRARREGSSWYYPKDESVRNCYEHVLREVEARGPLCSDDLPLNEKVPWPWGPTKMSRAALESLWLKGDLVLHHRSGARRYFDLSARHLPASVLAAPDPNPLGGGLPRLADAAQDRQRGAFAGRPQRRLFGRGHEGRGSGRRRFRAFWARGRSPRPRWRISKSRSISALRTCRCWRVRALRSRTGACASWRRSTT